MRTLDGKRVLVTGGARGIGRAIAEAFAHERAELLLTDVDAATLDATGEALRRGGAACRTYASDVTDTEAIGALVRRVHEDGGPVDVLVNNAGVVFGGPFGEIPLERHLLVYRVNVLGLVAMTHAFLPDLVSRPEGHVVNISSASGFIGLPFGATYASSKWAVTGFSESLRLELEMLGHGHVRVSNICPSYVATGLFDGAKPPRGTRMLQPEHLARRVVGAVLHGQDEVLVPWIVALTPKLKALLPRPLFELASAMTGATASMRAWRGHAERR